MTLVERSYILFQRETDILLAQVFHGSSAWMRHAESLRLPLCTANTHIVVFRPVVERVGHCQYAPVSGRLWRSFHVTLVAGPRG